MSNIRETCSCAATYDGEALYISRWRKDHRHELPPTPETDCAIMAASAGWKSPEQHEAGLRERSDGIAAAMEVHMHADEPIACKTINQCATIARNFGKAHE